LGFGTGEPTSTVGVAVSDWDVVADSEIAPPVTAPPPVDDISSCANSVVTDTSQNATQLGIEALARIFGWGGRGGLEAQPYRDRITAEAIGLSLRFIVISSPLGVLNNAPKQENGGREYQGSNTKVSHDPSPLSKCSSD
jgi:hypothetical protein